MDQISIKTPNPQCRLYWCLKEFMNWKVEIQSVMLVFSTPLVNYSAPLTFSLVHVNPLPPPFPVWISTGVCIHTVCNGGGGRGSGSSDRYTPVAKYLYWSIFKKSRRLGFGVFLDIWSICIVYNSRYKGDRWLNRLELVSWNSLFVL
jgi:hypothetical protein